MEIKAVVGSRLGSLTFNRSTSTNPFEKTSFRGKTFKGSALAFSDVFQAIKPVEKPNKLKMVTGAVIGAIVDFKTRLTQPIALFAHKVRENIARGVESVRNTKNSIVEMSKNMHERVTEKVASVFSRKPKVEEPVSDVAVVLDMKHINEKAHVRDLKATWVAENERIAKEDRKVA